MKQGQDSKNKVAPPFRIAEFDILYGEGVSKESELIDLGLNMTLLKKLVLGIVMARIE